MHVLYCFRPGMAIRSPKGENYRQVSQDQIDGFGFWIRSSNRHRPWGVVRDYSAQYCRLCFYSRTLQCSGISDIKMKETHLLLHPVRVLEQIILALNLNHRYAVCFQQRHFCINASHLHTIQLDGDSGRG